MVQGAQLGDHSRRLLRIHVCDTVLIAGIKENFILPVDNLDGWVIHPLHVDETGFLQELTIAFSGVPLALPKVGRQPQIDISFKS